MWAEKGERRNVMGSSRLNGESSLLRRAYIYFGNGRTTIGDIYVASFRHEESDAFLPFYVPVRLGAEAKDGSTDQPKPVFILFREVHELLGLRILKKEGQ